MPKKRTRQRTESKLRQRRKLEREAAAFFAVPDPEERKERAAYMRSSIRAIARDEKS